MSSKITQRQCFFLLFLFFIGNLVTASGAKRKPTGWLIFLLLALLSLPVLYLFTRAAKNRSAGSIFIDAFGKPVGITITVMDCILAVLLAGDAMRLFADFIVINDLNDAGAWGNTALLTLTVFFFLKQSKNLIRLKTAILIKYTSLHVMSWYFCCAKKVLLKNF